MEEQSFLKMLTKETNTVQDDETDFDRKIRFQKITIDGFSF